MTLDPRDRGGPAQPLLLVENLRKHFPVRGGLLNRKVATVQAVDDVSFAIRKGETLGIVGESGCGKSTTARLLMRLIEPDAGATVFDGETVGSRTGISVNAMRRQMQMVFQDSYSSLNPRMTMVDSISYAPAHARHAAATKPPSAREHLLDQVGLEPPHLRPPLPARTVRRPAPARQHRPRAGVGTAPGDPRRSRLRARQIDRGAGAEPARRPEGANST